MPDKEKPAYDLELSGKTALVTGASSGIGAATAQLLAEEGANVIVSYPIIIVTFGFVLMQALRKNVPWLVALPFAINLAANLIFTPIQFGMRNLPLAAVDILIVWGTIIWMMIAVWKHYRWIAVAQIPYFVWVSIATVLQLSITMMNL